MPKKSHAVIPLSLSELKLTSPGIPTSAQDLKRLSPLFLKARPDTPTPHSAYGENLSPAFPIQLLVT